MEKDGHAKIQIKEMAEELHLSPSTVSIVLSGKGDAMRISKETQKRIRTLARKRNYQPNIYAKRLRHAAGEEIPYVVALFWRQDNLNTRLGRFVQGIQNAVEKKGLRVELLLQPYEPGHLLKYKDMLSENRISAAIVCGLLEEEQKELEKLEILVPVVLIGRESEKFHCVVMDSYLAGEACAKVLGDDVKSGAMIGFVNGGASERRMEAGFLMGCRERQIEVKEDWHVHMDYSSHENGYRATEELLGKVVLPSAWLIADFRLAGGVVACCNEKGIRIPEELRLIFFEDSDVLKYHKPSLSAVDVPSMEMAEKALEIVLLACETPLDIPIRMEVKPLYYFRESVGGMSTNGKE